MAAKAKRRAAGFSWERWGRAHAEALGQLRPRLDELERLLELERASHEKTRAELRDARCGAEVAARRQVADAIAPLEADRARLERALEVSRVLRQGRLEELLAVPAWIRRLFRPRAQGAAQRSATASKVAAELAHAGDPAAE